MAVRCLAQWQGLFQRDPVYETPSLTPDLVREDGTELKVSIKELFNFQKGHSSEKLLWEVIILYRQWIHNCEEEIRLLDNKYRPAAERHLAACKKSRTGWSKVYVSIKNEEACLAFRFGKSSYVLQQLTGSTVRKASLDSNRLEFTPSYKRPDPNVLPEGKGYWRYPNGFFLNKYCFQPR